MGFTSEEKQVLNYFFTNLDKPVFGTRNFHPEVWALMQARYSRSKHGLRESFLKLLREDTSNFKKLQQEIQKTEGGIHAKHATEKAIRFMEKWVLGYGHSSVAEGAVIGLGMEGISILATKVIEDNRLCSFIEKSTRYVSFDSSSFYLDPDLMKSEYAGEIKKLVEMLFNTYMELHEPVLEYVKKKVPLEEGMTEAAWNRACAARRFDAIRYLLPTATKTSLGWTVNARQLAHAVSKLLSHPLKEMQELGEQVRKEAGIVLPSLLRYSDKKDYYMKTDKLMKTKADEIKTGYKPEKQEPGVSLVKASENPDNMIVAAMLYKYKNPPEPMKKIISAVEKMPAKEKEAVFDSYLKSMTKFDHPMRELEHVQFSFEIVMDYGAFRDLQRHRICTQTNPLLTADLGYDVPADIKNAGCKEKFCSAMDRAAELYEKLRKEYPLQAQYLLPLGFRKRYLISMNLREIYHLIKIRSTPLAHTSYRLIAYQLYELMKKQFPLLSKYIECNFSEEELGRLKSEERTEKQEGVGPL